MAVTLNIVTLAQFVGTLANCDPESIDGQTVLREILEPVDLAALIIKCEDRYSLMIPDELIREFITLSDLYNYIFDELQTIEDEKNRRAKYGE